MGEDISYEAFRRHAEGFKAKLLQTKRGMGPLDFEWYPHDSFSSLAHIDRLLTGEDRALFSGRKKILDVGCQDGDLSFCLEAAGHDVVALDHPAYNHNCMRGVRTLKAALSSHITLREFDLDRQIAIGGEYDLALIFGVLYHLRNPFFVLEELAKSAKYCLLSTRIARCFPDGSPMPPGVSIAYLLGERELNFDETNYFIFSEPGLRQLFRRTFWDLRGAITVGRGGDSDPVRLDRDERIFCLLKSRYGEVAGVEFLQGWHLPEESGWRWTQRNFSVRLGWRGERRPARLMVDLFLSEALMAHVGTLRMSIMVNGQPLPAEVYDSVGSKLLVRKLNEPMSAEYVLEFSLSGALPPALDDARERGVIVSSIRLE